MGTNLTEVSARRLSRAILVAAPAEAVFPHVNTLRQWEEWSPWAGLDPRTVTTYSGPAEGAGASFAWDGGMKSGKGRMTILESQSPQFVRINLEFEKPMKGTNQVEFTFVPENGGTRVTWTMSGKNRFMAKLVGIFVGCDKMVGGMFEKGLASLKAVAEGAVKV